MTNKKSENPSPHVTRVYVENRTGHGINDYVIESPTVFQVLDAIKLINGSTITMVILQMDGKNFGVGGGTNGRFTGELAFGIDKAFYSLLSSEGPATQKDKELDLVVGQQAVLVPKKAVLNRGTVLKAARFFAEYGDMCPDLYWEKHD